MTDTPTLSVSTALLQWVQTFSTTPPATSLSSLRDGHILYQILRNIGSEYFIDPLPSPAASTETNWIPRWQNLKYIDKVVRSYVRDVCGVLDSSTQDESGGGLTVDLKAVAQLDGEKGERDMVVLLKGILRAAMYSPVANQRMGRVVVGLGPDVAKVIATTLAEMEENESVQPDEGGVVESIESDGNRADDDVFGQENAGTRKESGTGGRDLGLEEEEKLIQAHRIIRQLEESNAKAATELEDLRKNKASLEEALESFRYEMENSGQKRTENDALRELRSRADKDRDYIAELETELETTRTTADSHERQLQRLKAEGDSKQKLKDDLQVIKAERDDLLNRSRANENLRKKIQTLQDQEKQNSTLRDDLRSAQDQLQSLEALKQKCEALQKANTENMNIIANTEQEIFDQKTSKKRLEHEYKVLQQKWEIARERQVRDHELIAELESKLQSIQDSSSNTGLDDELTTASRPPHSRSQSTAITVPSADLSLLEEKLSSLTARNTKLETDYLDLLQDKLGLETSLSELRDPEKEPEANIPFLEQRKKLLSAQDDLTKLRESMYATTAELAATKEKLLAHADDLNGAKNEGMDKDSEYASLTRSYASLTSHAQDVETQLAEQRSLLRHALLGHTALLMEPEEVRKRNEYDLVRAQLEEVRSGEDESVVVDVATSVTGRIEKGRDGENEAKSKVEAYEAEIAALKGRVEAMEKREKEGGRDGEGKGMTESERKGMEQLRLENRLVASAWYDLAGRLGSNTVSVGRRREDPKSWLGKQRRLVGLGINGGVR